MPTSQVSPLAVIEPRLRPLLPADLYAVAWLDPSAASLTRVFEHLRTLQRILYDYVPRQVSDTLPSPGEVRHQWQDSTLMFTDLAGFTPLLEANAGHGMEGATTLLGVLNRYFAEMIEIISKSGGNLLEFTGDAMLAQFASDSHEMETAQAVRAGLRMQRAMAHFGTIETNNGPLSLGMRIGLHTGRFLTADIGTPHRSEHVLLGHTVQRAKLAEGAGKVGRVCLTEAAHKWVIDEFDFEGHRAGYLLVKDNFTAEQLGEYEVLGGHRRPPNPLLMDRSIETVMKEIEQIVTRVEPLASYLPAPILNLLVESAARRGIPPDFPQPTVMFVNLLGLPEAVDEADPNEARELVNIFSRAFALINAAVESRGGVLKKVTYHLSGSDIMIYFGAPQAHTDDPTRAADAALAIRDIINQLRPPVVGDHEIIVTSQMGLASGPAFAAEIGEPRGRREFNVLGDTVNTAARLMGHAEGNQILISEAVYRQISYRFQCLALPPMALKGKSAPLNVYSLDSALPR